MLEDRKPEEFETDTKDWKVYFDLEWGKARGLLDSAVFVKISINRNKYPLTEKDIEDLKQDLRDLGKLRIIKQGKEFLEK
jgi:hypothetical protein